LEARLAIAKLGNFIHEDQAKGGMMRITLNIVAILFLLVGTIWFLQGINVLPGSFMTGQTRWAVYGGIAIAVGITLLLGANRPRKSVDKEKV
jgi:hypothetical protein